MGIKKLIAYTDAHRAIIFAQLPVEEIYGNFFDWVY